MLALAALIVFVGWLARAGGPASQLGEGRVVQVSIVPAEGIVQHQAEAAAHQAAAIPAEPEREPALQIDRARDDSTKEPEPPSSRPPGARGSVSTTQVHAANSASLSAAFQQDIYDHVARYRRYPAAARAERLSGIVQLYFEVDRQGAVSNIRVASSSGHLILDSEAVDTIRRAAPLPPVPLGLAGRQRVLLPIDFSLKRSTS
ncbi:energy transducer TonB family protein [Blastochloris viridis]|uniref:energy transducer TonB family protein n=1 Tax=Blastochloris viridis TaxID=1079 RepID=UPI00147004DD|nr:energy transducer TonB [Blastochloris viridis]